MKRVTSGEGWSEPPAPAGPTPGERPARQAVLEGHRGPQRWNIILLTLITYGKYKPAFLVIAAIIILLEFAGAVAVFTQAYEGFWTGPDYTVVKVFPDSPAERADFAVGDVLKSIDGIEVQDFKTAVRRPNPKVGETRAYRVERNGAAMTLSLQFSGLPARVS